MKGSLGKQIYQMTAVDAVSVRKTWREISGGNGDETTWLVRATFVLFQHLCSRELKRRRSEDVNICGSSRCQFDFFLYIFKSIFDISRYFDNCLFQLVKIIWKIYCLNWFFGSLRNNEGNTCILIKTQKILKNKKKNDHIFFFKWNFY